MNVKIPTQNEIREAAKNAYGSGSYWQGVKTDAFREGAKWAVARLRELNSGKNTEANLASKA